MATEIGLEAAHSVEAVWRQYVGLKKFTMDVWRLQKLACKLHILNAASATKLDFLHTALQ